MKNCEGMRKRMHASGAHGKAHGTAVRKNTRKSECTRKSQHTKQVEKRKKEMR